MGKKHTEINIIKNPKYRDLTFVSDPVKAVILQHASLQENESNAGTYDDKDKLVKKARRDINRFSMRDLQNRSKQGLSKQNHSPVYE
jgi:hypothetical protein